MFFNIGAVALLSIGLCHGWSQHIAPKLYGRDLSDSDPALDYCFSEGSICVIENNLYHDCEQYDDFSNLGPWYKCICSNGYVAADD